MKTLTLSLLSLAILFGSTTIKTKLSNAEAAQIKRQYQPLYLPEAKFVKLLTGGFDNFTSDILWFNTNSYFGSQYQGEKDYRWMEHMCELVSRLDPRDAIRIESCATLLSWIVKDPEASNRLLDLGIEQNPDYWRLYYMRGFNYWYFLEDKDKAKKDLAHAASLPDTPHFVTSMAARLISDINAPKAAVEFLENQISATKDPTAKEALEEKLQSAVMTWHLDELEKAKSRYQTKYGTEANSLNTLIKAGFLRAIPEEPFGGTYQIENNEVVSTSGERKLKFEGKTARTGAFKNEFKNFENLNSVEVDK